MQDKLPLIDAPGLPLYRRIMHSVEQAVASGQLRPGDKLPAHVDMARQWGVSPMTVRKAYDLLQNEGLLLIKHGHGTFIVEKSAAAAAADSLANVALPRRLFVVIGEPTLAHCLQETLFITVDKLQGIKDVLGTHLPLVYLKDLRPTSLASHGPITHQDAVVVIHTPDKSPAQYDALLSRGVPVIHSQNALQDSRLHWVKYDRQHAVRLACEHLVGQGHRRIGYIGLTHLNGSTHEKYAAFAASLNEAGLDVLAALVRHAHPAPGQGYKAMADMLDQAGPRPDALLVDSDLKAMEVITALSIAGLSVPEDISVIGYDDIPDAAVFRPPLTTVRTPRREIGREIGKIIQQHFTSLQVRETTSGIASQHARLITLKARLVVRASTQAFSGASHATADQSSLEHPGS